MKQMMLGLFLLAGYWTASAQTPGTAYDMQPLKQEKIALADWMHQLAISEGSMADSALNTGKDISPAVKNDLILKKILCRFITGDYQQVIQLAEQYGKDVSNPVFFNNNVFPELVAYAKAASAPEANFTFAFSSIFEKSLAAQQPKARRQLTEYLSDRMISAEDKLHQYIATAPDTIYSQATLVYCWLYANTMLSSRAGKEVLAFARAEESKSYIVDDEMRIPLRNGLLLSGISVRSRNFTGPLPVVLMVNCYATNSDYDRNRMKLTADSGYMAVIVYPRGKAQSEGVFHPFENDARDNYDIIDWISKQPWCNGRIGMFGGSYLGFTQWAATKYYHPALKTIVPQVAVGPGIDYPNPEGIFMSYCLQWIKYVTNNRFTDDIVFSLSKKWDEWKTTYLENGMAFNKLDSIHNGKADTIFQRWLQHPARDAFWQQMIPDRKRLAAIDIPILTTTGYFDADQRGAMYYYNMHNRYAGAKSSQHYLMIGPFDHGGAQGGRVKASMPPYTVDSAAMINQKQLVLEWFGYTLKGGPKPAFLKDRVSVFTMDENKWHHFPSIERMNRDTLSFYMQRSSDTLLLSERKNKLPATVALPFNTQDIANDTVAWYRDNNANTEKLFQRKDLIRLATAPLKDPITLNGSILADLYLSQTAPDADITVSWWEQDVNGKLWPLSKQIVRLSHTQDITRRTPWKKGKIYHVKLDNGPWMSKRIAAGSKLITLVHPAVGFYWEKNYGGSRPVSRQTNADATDNTITLYMDESHPSMIKIPCM
jgi:hypothetical protein